MINRKIEQRIKRHFKNDTNALLITGARQVGKTYIIRKYGKENYKSFVEINFLENKSARDLFENAKNSQDILFRLSAIVDKPLVEGETLIFFDEVQECKEIVTAIKFLVEDGTYKYILSGSLLGVDLKDVRSMPVGYMDIMEMYPLDFEEFALANGVSKKIVESLSLAFKEKTTVDPLVHERMMDLFHLYLIVGGMPAEVSKYLETNNLQEVERQQRAIITLYKQDISKYDPQNKLYLEDIFSLIPSELNTKNKRFILKNLNENFKFSRYTNSFLWLKNAGVALPAFSVSEPTIPLMMNKSANLFKLFLSDVGLLASMYMDGIQLKILNKEADINFGSVYENAAAQELKAHGFELYYFNSKKQGEIDFVIEQDGKVIPIEIKSGKDYARHAALDNVLANASYNITEAYVFHNGNVEKKSKIIYYPVYMLMFIKKDVTPQEQIYKIDMDILK